MLDKIRSMFDELYVITKPHFTKKNYKIDNDGIFDYFQHSGSRQFFGALTTRKFIEDYKLRSLTMLYEVRLSDGKDSVPANVMPPDIDLQVIEAHFLTKASSLIVKDGSRIRFIFDDRKRFLLVGGFEDLRLKRMVITNE